MPRERTELEAREGQTLAPYAQLSGDTRGRVHPEPPPEWRTQFQRDRDRVIHSRAFRRLEYKTQVFLNGTGDHLRTRLTHTMEVAAISRNIARALGLNEDLAETIALAHDLGHAPFGHNGEYALNDLMKDDGGFEHNRHSLRIVETLETKYPAFAGLNLTWEVREGLVKHFTGFDLPQPKKEFSFPSSSLEAQVANLADEIAYYSHDLDDGLESGLLSEAALCRDVAIWADAERSEAASCQGVDPEIKRYFIIRCIIDGQVKDVVHTTEARLRDAAIQTADQARNHPGALVAYGEARARKNRELRKYLYQNLYFNPEVHRPNQQAVDRLKRLFQYFVEHPEALPAAVQDQTAALGLKRAVCDHLASMTDRLAIATCDELV